MNRIQRLRELLEPGESLLVTHLINVRYLCGFTGSYGVLLISPDEAMLFTDSRYTLAASAQCFDVEVRTCTNALQEAVVHSSHSLAVESEHISLAQYSHIANTTQVALRESKGLVEQLRVVKDPSEIARIREACHISTQALTQLVTTIRLGMSERHISRLLVNHMLDAGADAPAFDSIVASGPHSAIPHHEPTDRQLERGDLLKIDFGAQVHGYHADCTRVFSIGPAADWQRETHSAVVEAAQTARSLVRHDAALADVDAAARGALADHPHVFGHGLGHGVGLEIHEDPFFRPHSTGRLRQDMTVTVEPGLYLPERGGVRIEDTVLVTATGYENLTGFPYDLINIEE